MTDDDDKLLNNNRLIRGRATSQVSGDFSVGLRGSLRFVFNFELGQ